MQTTPHIDEVKDQFCADCGEDDPRVLEFDDVGREVESYMAVRQMLDQTWVAPDVAQMGEILCANCHRRRIGSRQALMRELMRRLP